MNLPRKRGRKLLVASLGVAAVSYVGCSSSKTSTGTDAGKATANDATAQMSVGNLMVAPSSDADDDSNLAMMSVGNLMVAQQLDGGEDLDGAMVVPVDAPMPIRNNAGDGGDASHD